MSGNVCAFPGCDRRLVEPGTNTDDPAVLGEMAHIVGEKRRGPRGADEMPPSERNSHANLVLLCGDHHKLIDSQPNAYSVPVLRAMKSDHEARIPAGNGWSLRLPRDHTQHVVARNAPPGRGVRRPLRDTREPH